MHLVETSELGHRYGRVRALRSVDLAVPEGSLYALLGPNGSGKTTLLQILMGLQRATFGEAKVLGRDVRSLRAVDRARIGYVAEGQRLPGWMTVRQLEAYLAPLYESWDATFAAELRRRFRLPADRSIGSLSRGEQMKAALLCGLAPRPRLLVLDEPFTGMDALVKDELVSGLLESAGLEGSAVLLCSQDIGELELLADWVGMLDRGTLVFSEPMDRLRERYRRVEVMVGPGVEPATLRLPEQWLAAEWSGRRGGFLVTDADVAPVEQAVAQWLPDVERLDVRPASLREVFVSVAKQRFALEEVD